MMFEDWGLTPYAQATEKQLKLVDEISSGAGERIIFCTHPPVITLGRASVENEVSGWNGDVVHVSRGGKATYHGPNQLVVYPLIDLKKERAKIPVRDVGAYLRELENWSIRALQSLDLTAHAISTPKGEEKIYTGVWIGEHKVASIGIAVKKWITYHGLAINLEPDQNAFRGINPCGFKREVMSDLSSESGAPISYQEMKDAFISASQW